MKFKNASQKRFQVAVMINMANSWGRKVVQGVLRYVNEVDNWDLWIKPNSPHVFDGLPLGWHGDGVITRVASQKLVRSLKKWNLHIVNVNDDDLKGFSAPTIRTDDTAGCHMAIEHFMSIGMTRVGYIGADIRQTHIQYRDAFLDAAENRGMKCSVYRFSTEEIEVKEALLDWLKSVPKPIGILVLSNYTARMVIDACFIAKINVPQDIAILSSSDDFLLSRACFPPLSGLVPPTEEIGYQAAQALHQLMLGKEVSHEPVKLPPLGVEKRQSTDVLSVEDKRLHEAMAYLREHAFEPITMEDILKVIPMSRRSLERHFKETFGHTPFDEIRFIRVERARKLLLETDLEVQQIAEKCGYGSYNYLGKIFKETTGLTPFQYRKRYRDH
ncbi:MAG: DNA-binding transcriptional regulator [Verrucomicrobiota bacterium]